MLSEETRSSIPIGAKRLLIGRKGRYELQDTKPPAFKLEEVLSLANMFDYSEPRDQIYRFLELLTDDVKIEVEYRKPLTDVYWEAVSTLRDRYMDFMSALQIVTQALHMGATGLEETACKEGVLEHYATVWSGHAPSDVIRSIKQAVLQEWDTDDELIRRINLLLKEISSEGGQIETAALRKERIDDNIERINTMFQSLSIEKDKLKSTASEPDV
jgi:hypothetical protein